MGKSGKLVSTVELIFLIPILDDLLQFSNSKFDFTEQFLVGIEDAFLIIGVSETADWEKNVVLKGKFNGAYVPTTG